MASPTGGPEDIPGLGDLLGDAPLLREIQRVMLSGTGPINWELARQIGIATASWGAEDPPPTDEDRQGFEDTVRAAELAVADFTGLPQPGDVPRVEVLRRAQWVEANVRSLRDVLDPVAQKLTSAMAQQGGPFGMMGEADPGADPGEAGPRFIPGFTGGPPEPSMGGSGEGGPEAGQGAEMLQALLGQMVPLLMGAQVGTVLGYLAQRVLSQFDLPVPQSGPGLLFVIPNIAQLERDWSLPKVEFRAWVALHEVAHRLEFAGAWVRPHFVELVKDLVENAEIDLSGLARRMEGMDLANPDALAEAFEGMGNLFGHTDSTEQRLRIARVQAFIAAAEAYADHVVEAVGRRMLGSVGQIEEAMRRHREGAHGEQALERLIGLEMRPESYQLGRQFCETVVERTDEATLARMWESAEALPSTPELEEPTLWLSRIA